MTGSCSLRKTSFRNNFHKHTLLQTSPNTMVITLTHDRLKVCREQQGCRQSAGVSAAAEERFVQVCRLHRNDGMRPRTTTTFQLIINTKELLTAHYFLFIIWRSDRGGG
ncbi:hypothetical protein FQA47_005790 [Oryzias melastigma]|uniref:Uncharacterized protein n=1 Tax=Oryzias melastigma TaxID=30732 RepID=A0A834FT36_ORYME|nr:hypothetical protein FQA47_005790 [Oryzias melastigma]